MQYDLFVFAGQSNTMGACVFPPKHKPDIKYSFEYKYKPVYLGGDTGKFVPVGYDCGEFLYKDISAAYKSTDESGQSRLNDYFGNAYFAPSLSNLKNAEDKSVYPFSHYSESDRNTACCIVPYFCEEWEKLGGRALTAHIAQGGVSAVHFFSKDMADEYNRFAKLHGYNPIIGDGAAEAVYCGKCKAFFHDAEKLYGGDNIGEKVLVWNQGESDPADSCEEYAQKLRILWNKARGLGFCKLFIIRTGYWFTHDTCRVMHAQEKFCAENSDAYIITRDISFMPDLHFMENIENFYTVPPAPEYLFCRDSYYGYENSHINEKGFMIAARSASKNAYRVSKEHKEPDLKHDIIKY